MKEKLLEVKNLNVEYHSDSYVFHAVNGISFDLGCQETIGLVGETGAGKTTTALAIMQLLSERTSRVNSGEIIFKGENILARSREEMQELRGAKISMIFQDPMSSLNPVLTVGDQILEVLQEHNDPAQASDILGELEQKLQDAALKPQTSTGADTGDVTVDHTGHVGTTPGYFQAPGHSFEEEDNSGELGQMAMSSQEKLFQDVEGTPVKVGEVFELDTQADDMDMQVADLIRSALIQDLNELEVRLTPANLGTVTIKLTQGSDGALSVIIHTSNAKTAALLSEHLDGLNQAIQSTQNREVRVAVQYNEESQQSQYQQTDPDGHNGQQRQQEHHTEEQESGEDFVQRLRLGLVGVEDEA